MLDPDARRRFLNLAAGFEGSLVLVALFGGWVVGVNPLTPLQLDLWAIAVAVAATIPMFIMFLVFHYFPVGPFRRIRAFLIDVIGPILDTCRWYDLILLAALAGLSEEILFRGLLQTWMGQSEPVIGLIGSNVLFGLAHSITLTYGLIAAAMGTYFGWLFDATGERNLLIPVITHALYDYLAFLVVVRTVRQERKRVPADSQRGSADDDSVIESPVE